MTVFDRGGKGLYSQHRSDNVFIPPGSPNGMLYVMAINVKHLMAKRYSGSPRTLTANHNVHNKPGRGHVKH